MVEDRTIVHLLGVLGSLVRDAGILARSVSDSREDLLASIAGEPESWRNPGELSEFAYFRDQFAAPWADLGWGDLASPDAIWQRVLSLDRVRARLLPLPFLREPPSSFRQSTPEHGSGAFPEEAWFFVNGVATDRNILRLNGAFLSELFGRPIELIYNPTHGIVPDLLECVTGRTFDYASATAAYAVERVASALEDPTHERVVLMGHSQGGIIVSNVAAGLVGRFGGDASLLGKLEIYTFASACDAMPVDPILDSRMRRVPYLEHFANTGDLVARLGVLERTLEIPGRVHCLQKTGHLLNAHYLPELARRRYAWHAADRARGSDQASPRLYGYLGGETPPLLAAPRLDAAPRQRSSPRAPARRKRRAAATTA